MEVMSDKFVTPSEGPGMELILAPPIPDDVLVPTNAPPTKTKAAEPASIDEADEREERSLLIQGITQARVDEMADLGAYVADYLQEHTDDQQVAQLWGLAQHRNNKHVIVGKSVSGNPELYAKIKAILEGRHRA